MEKKPFVNIAFELLRYAFYGAAAGSHASLQLQNGQFRKGLRDVNKLSKMTGLPVATINQLMSKNESLAKQHLQAAYVLLLWISTFGTKKKGFRLSNLITEEVSKDTNIKLSDLKEFKKHIKQAIMAHGFQIFVLRPIEESLKE